MTAVDAAKALPTEFALRRVLSDILGRDVTVAHAAGPALEDGRGLLALYRDDAGDLVAVAGWDLGLVCGAGGALGLVPPAVCAEAVRDRVPRADLVENTLELCNVLVAAFDQERGPVARFAGHHLPASLADVELREFANRHANRLDLTVTVPGYGSGTLSVAVRT